MSSRAPLCHFWALLRLPSSETDHTRWTRCLWAPATTLNTHTNIRNARLGATAASRTGCVRELVLASKLQLRLAAACASRRSLDAPIHGSLPHRARTQRSGRGWAALLGQRWDGTVSGGGTWDVASGDPSSMRRTGWMVSMSCSATGAHPSLVQHQQHPFAPSAGRSVPRRGVPLSRARTARAPSSPLICAAASSLRLRKSACGGVAVPR